eukprot:5469547-Prymnesium_polylepis.1
MCCPLQGEWWPCCWVRLRFERRQALTVVCAPAAPRARRASAGWSRAAGATPTGGACDGGGGPDRGTSAVASGGRVDAAPQRLRA